MDELEGRMRTLLDAALDAAFSHVRGPLGTTALDGLTSFGCRALIDLRNRSTG
ncbi:hypothetical protein ABIA03_002394 [Bradyrhizobium yuanmingense]|uniref:Uncharacterized protein n=1 Tax=Bradyrhizobium yuanmingense TaxID=108015 RepID=A0ABV4GKG9_9BRAD